MKDIENTIAMISARVISRLMFLVRIALPTFSMD
jgi:hypothetical protein